MRPSLYILAWLVGAGCSEIEPYKGDEPGAGVGSVITGDDIVGGDGGSTSVPDETCDGIDNDGDGEVDEGTLLTFYVDADGDGYGGEAVEACEAPLGTVGTDGGRRTFELHPECGELRICCVHFTLSKVI